MTFPSAVTVGPVTFTIQPDHALTNATQCWGHIDYARQAITIDPVGGDDHIAVTVLHELLHAHFHLGGIGDRDNGEQTITKLSPLLLDTLRRNPGLVAYLIGGEA